MFRAPSWMELDLADISLFMAKINSALRPIDPSFHLEQARILSPAHTYKSKSTQYRSMCQLAGGIDIKTYFEFALTGGLGCRSSVIRYGELELLEEVGYQTVRCATRLQTWRNTGSSEPSRTWLHRAVEWLLDGTEDRRSVCYMPIAVSG